MLQTTDGDEEVWLVSSQGVGGGVGGVTKSLVLKSIRSFSRTNPSRGKRNTPLFIQAIPKGVAKSSGPF